MGKEIRTFDDSEIEKWISHCYKNPILKKDVDINNINI